ncbi:MAG: MoxR family ATPase [Pseudomonadota bacterium]
MNEPPATAERASDTVEAGPALERLKREICRHIIGHDQLVDELLAAVLAGGHVLLEGVPGLGKTLLARVLGATLGLPFARIQFTPDLMPADIIGTRIVMQDEAGQRQFEFQPGPLFTELLLADEVNRATPKTQSALLEAMEERQVTVGRDQHQLSRAFTVLATQNPIEMEGTYPLPEAQLDRFMLKLTADFPNAEALATIVDRETAAERAPVEQVFDFAQLDGLRKQTREIALARHVRDFAVGIMLATHPDHDTAPAEVRRYVRHGASPRGVLSMILTGKALALMDGRLNVSFDDIATVAAPALRHRVLLNFEGEAAGVNANTLVASIVEATPRGDS